MFLSLCNFCNYSVAVSDAVSVSLTDSVSVSVFLMVQSLSKLTAAHTSSFTVHSFSSLQLSHTSVEFNTTEGEIGVYPDHIPLTTVLAPGVVTITNGEDVKEAAVHAGFAEILGDKVTLLAEIAEWPDEIDEKRAEAAKERAEARIAAKAADTDMLRAEFALRKALVRIEVKH